MPMFAINPRLAEVNWLINKLALQCQLSTESAFLLIGNLHLWDASILVRSVLEGTYKLAYLCLGDETERSKKCVEFRDTLPEIMTFERSERALKLKLHRSNEFSWEPTDDAILSEEEINIFRAKYPRRDRSRLKQKWNFTEIAAQLSTIGDDVLGAGHASLMLYNYHRYSHFAHKDGDSCLLLYNRTFRDDVRREAVELVHAVDAIDILLALSVIRMKYIYDLNGGPNEAISNFAIEVKELINQVSPAIEEWKEIEYGLTRS